jgi:hypothetical protein
MGTSKSYEAPPSWGPLKALVTRVAGEGSLTPQRGAEVLNEYVAQSGGARGGSQGGGPLGRSGAAQNTARALAGFVSLVSRDGLDEALRQSGLGELVGRPVTEIILGLVDHCGGPGSAIDQVDAKNATSRLLHEILDDAPDPAAVDTVMKELAQGARLVELLETFFGYCLYEEFCRVFFERLVKRHGDDRARSFLGEILDFILSALANHVLGLDVTGIDWFGDEGRRIADNIMEQTLGVFES